MRVNYDRITTTIEREWLAQIIAGTKKIEYRQIKLYWTKRFRKVALPFELRLLNGMTPPVPEVTVLIHKITKDRRAGDYLGEFDGRGAFRVVVSHVIDPSALQTGSRIAMLLFSSFRRTLRATVPCEN